MQIKRDVILDNIMAAVKCITAMEIPTQMQAMSDTNFYNGLCYSTMQGRFKIKLWAALALFLTKNGG